jgi:hypothetical protein
VWLESGFAENSTLHSSFRCLRLVVESSTLFFGYSSFFFCSSFLLFVFVICLVRLNKIQFVVELITTRSQCWMISKCMTNIRYIF